MRTDDVARNAFAIPLTSPSFPTGPHRFHNRAFFTITCRSDPTFGRGQVVFDFLQSE